MNNQIHRIHLSLYYTLLCNFTYHYYLHKIKTSEQAQKDLDELGTYELEHLLSSEDPETRQNLRNKK